MVNENVTGTTTFDMDNTTVFETTTQAIENTTDFTTYNNSSTTASSMFSTSTVINNITDIITSSPNFTVTTTGNPTDHKDSDHKDLVWVLPAVFGIVFFLFGIGCILIYFIRRCEIAVQKCCYARFGWCPPMERDKRSYKELKEDSDLDVDSFHLRDLKQRSPFDAGP